MFEDLDLNISEIKESNGLWWPPPTHTSICQWQTSKRACSETSIKYCC